MRINGPTRVEIDGRCLTSFAGTNYLGLSFHPRVVEALARASSQSGFGMGASRRTTGTTDELLELERASAAFAGSGSAIVTTSGTLANIGVIDGLRGAVDHWLVDENAHPSFTRFLPISGATLGTYRHADADDLAAQLRNLTGRAAVYTDAVFPLTGEIAPLKNIAHVSRDVLLVFDEAHSLGVLGEGGKGLASHLGLLNERTILTATFTKALGCSGGLILGPRPWLDRIREQSDVLASTSALSPSLAAAATVAISAMEDEPERLARLRANTRLMRELLGMETEPLAAPIFSSPDNAIERSARALEAGFLVPVVSSYPGSPPAGMLRWIVSSEHTESEIRNVSALLRSL